MTLATAMPYLRPLRAAAFLIVLQFAPALAGPGHDHGATPAGATAPASPRVVMTSENYQFIGIVEGEVMVIYLDRAHNNEPVTTAIIELSIEGETVAAALKSDGVYEAAAPLLKTPGPKEVLATIADGDVSDLLVGAVTIPPSATQTGVLQRIGGATELAKTVPLGAGLIGFGVFIGALMGGRRKMAFVVLALSALVFASGAALAHEGHDHGPEPAASGNAPQRRPDGSIFLPKPSQRLLEVRTEIVRNTSATPTVRYNARIIADPRLSGVVQSTIGGRFVAPDGGVVTQGAAVKAGQLLGRVKPSFASIDSSQLLQSLAELDQQIALSKQRLARQEPLLNTSAITLAQVEETRFLLAAQTARRRELVASLSREEDLVAPVSGVIAASRAIAGQVVGQSDRLFEIVDPTRPLVEALVFDASILDRIGGAEMTLPDGEIVQLRMLGRSRTLQQQYASVQFEIAGAPRAMNIGQPVAVAIETGAPVEGIVVPRAALAQAPNGQTVVFEHKEPEIFVPRPVRTEALDSRRVRVLAGLREGDKIVTRNAPLVNQVR